MQLLQITTTPVKYEMEIEHAKLEIHNQLRPQMEMHTTPAKVDINTKNIQVKLNTYQARSSLGLRNAYDQLRMVGDRAQASVASKTREFVQNGRQMADIEDGVNIAQIIGQKMLQQPAAYTAFLPAAGADISWEPNRINIEATRGSTDVKWANLRNVLNYVPGSVRLHILEYPRVEIEYMGEPIYIPASAAPDYKEPEAG